MTQIVALYFFNIFVCKPTGHTAVPQKTVVWPLNMSPTENGGKSPHIMSRENNTCCPGLDASAEGHSAFEE